MSLKDAIRSWDIEVEAKAEELIKRGVPPYEAVEQAVKIVSSDRRHPKENTKNEQATSNRQ